MPKFDSTISWVIRIIYYPISTFILIFSLLLWMFRLSVVISTMSFVMVFENYRGGEVTSSALETIKRVASIGPELVSRLWSDPWSSKKPDARMAYGLSEELIITIISLAVIYFSAAYYNFFKEFIAKIAQITSNSSMPGYFLYISLISVSICLILTSILHVFRKDENVESILYWISTIFLSVLLFATIAHAFVIHRSNEKANSALKAAMDGAGCPNGQCGR